MDDIQMRVKLGKYLREKKGISPLQLPVELEKCVQSIKLWCSRYCTGKEHNDLVLQTVVETLCQ